MGRYRKDVLAFAARREYCLNGIEFEGTPCRYCGLPATDTEHVIPKSFTDALSDIEGVLPARLSLVPACRECNGIASDHVFQNISSKRVYIHQQLRARYNKFLEIPLWTMEQLSDLSPELARYVKHGLNLKEITLSRLNWPKGSGVVSNVGLGLIQGDNGNGSVNGNAELSSIMSKSTQRWNGSKAMRAKERKKRDVFTYRRYHQLTAEENVIIWKCYAGGKCSRTFLADILGVSINTVNRVLRKKL